MRKIWLALFLVLVFGIVGAPLADAYKGKVTIALRIEPPSYDPHIISHGVASIVWRWPYDTLLSQETGTGKIIPWLATKWKKLSPTKTKFWLRKGVKFTDGTPFTSEAVKYSIGRIMDPKNKSTQRAYHAKPFDRIEIIDDHTLIWHHKVHWGGFFNRISAGVHIMSPKTKGMKKGILSRNTFGTGAYILKSWTKGMKAVFEANPDWWGNSRYPNRPKTVVLRRIKESATRVKALIAGEVDVIRGVGHQFIPELERNPNTVVGSVPAIRVCWVSFATRFGGPFLDRKVRKAVNYAIDSESIRKTLLGGMADTFDQVYHPWCFSGYNPNKRWYRYDLEAAKALMKESSYPNGFKAVLFTTHKRYAFDVDVAVAVARMLKKIGIDVTIKTVVFPVYRRLFRNYQTGKTKGAAMVFRCFGNRSGDPAGVARSTLSCTGAWSLDCFKDLDAQIDKASATVDPKQRQIEYEKVTDMIKKRALHRIFFKLRDIFAYRKGLKFSPRHDETLFAFDIAVE
ncbi:ABC transporter substrate-binding protein [Nitrospinota bacterium]